MPVWDLRLDESELLEGEEVVWLGRPHWKSMLSFYAKWLLLAVGVLVVAWLLDLAVDVAWWPFIVAALLIGAIVVGIGQILRLRILYVVTTRQIAVRFGLVARENHSASLTRVQDVALKQSVLDRVFGVGTLEFVTAASGDEYEFRFNGIADPVGLERRLRELLLRATSGGDGVTTP